jgi:hypothetical protein
MEDYGFLKFSSTSCEKGLYRIITIIGTFLARDGSRNRDRACAYCGVKFTPAKVFRRSAAS